LQSSSFNSPETSQRINTTNHHGQALLHKAAYMENISMLAYLLHPPGLSHTATIHIDIQALISSPANNGVKANDKL